jgi:hypothetical protein
MAALTTESTEITEKSGSLTTEGHREHRANPDGFDSMAARTTESTEITEKAKRFVSWPSQHQQIRWCWLGVLGG